MKKRLLITGSTFPRYENDTEPRFILDLAKYMKEYAGGDGCGVLIKHGEIIKKFEEDKLLAVLKDELDNWKD